MAVLHTSVFYIISINVKSLSPVRNNCVCALYVPVGIFIRSHFSSHPITPKTFPIDGLIEGSKEVEMCGSVIWAVWRVGNNSCCELNDYCFRFQNCMWSCGVLLMGYFSNVWGRSLVTRICKGFKILNVQIWGNFLTTWHYVDRSHTFCIPPQPTKTDLVRCASLSSAWPFSELVIREAYVVATVSDSLKWVMVKCLSELTADSMGLT